MATAVEEIITDKTISPVFQRTTHARGWIDIRASEIRQELARVSLVDLPVVNYSLVLLLFNSGCINIIYVPNVSANSDRSLDTSID